MSAFMGFGRTQKTLRTPPGSTGTLLSGSTGTLLSPDMDNMPGHLRLRPDGSTFLHVETPEVHICYFLAVMKKAVEAGIFPPRCRRYPSDEPQKQASMVSEDGRVTTVYDSWNYRRRDRGSSPLSKVSTSLFGS